VRGWRARMSGWRMACADGGSGWRARVARSGWRARGARSGWRARIACAEGGGRGAGGGGRRGGGGWGGAGGGERMAGSGWRGADGGRRMATASSHRPGPPVHQQSRAINYTGNSGEWPRRASAGPANARQQYHGRARGAIASDGPAKRVCPTPGYDRWPAWRAASAPHRATPRSGDRATRTQGLKPLAPGVSTPGVSASLVFSWRRRTGSNRRAAAGLCNPRSCRIGRRVGPYRPAS